jgi:hypothetical protein
LVSFGLQINWFVLNSKLVIESKMLYKRCINLHLAIGVFHQLLPVI